LNSFSSVLKHHLNGICQWLLFAYYILLLTTGLLALAMQVACSRVPRSAEIPVAGGVAKETPVGDAKPVWGLAVAGVPETA
jgi:hypothetical protein